MGKVIRNSYLKGCEILGNVKGKKFGGKKPFAMKVDISEAYDRVKWNFLSNNLERLSFPLKRITLILQCVYPHAVRYSIVIISEVSKTFQLGEV